MLSRLSIDGRIVLKCMLRIQDGKAWTGFMWDGDKWQDFKMWY
jgi:hypothetical protein